MEYPGAKFTRPLRRALLVFFIALFFIISPMVVLFASGYRYDWYARRPVKNGSMSIDVEPETTQVIITGNRLKFNDDVPVRLMNIPPDKYTVRLAADGYYPWIKDLEVKSKQTAYIKEIGLLRQKTPDMIVSGQIANLALSDDGAYLLYILQREKITEIWSKNQESRTPAILMRFSNTEPLKITWAPNNRYAVVSNLEPPYRRVTIINPDLAGWYHNIRSGTQPLIEKFQWNNSNEPELIYSAKKTIKSILFPGKQTRTVAKNNFADWFMEQNQLWTLRFNTTSRQYVVFKDSLGFPSEYRKLKKFDNATSTVAPNNWDIIAARSGNILLKQPGAPQMLLITPQDDFDINAERFLISRYNNWWLFWTPWELWSYSPSEQPYLLNRSGEQLRFVEPLDQYNTLGLIWANKATALYPYYLVTQTLLSGDIRQFATDSERKILYLLGTLNGHEGLWSLEY